MTSPPAKTHPHHPDHPLFAGCPGLSLGPSAPQPPTPAAASTALSCAHKAVAVSPLLAAAHNTLGLAQQAAGDGAAAVRAFATAAALAGESFAAVARPAAGLRSLRPIECDVWARHRRARPSMHARVCGDPVCARPGV